MKKGNGFRLLAVIGAGLGFVATLISNWANEKEQEALIEAKVNEALNKKDEEGS